MTDDVNGRPPDDGEQRALPQYTNILDAAIRRASKLAARVIPSSAPSTPMRAMRYLSISSRPYSQPR